MKRKKIKAAVTPLVLLLKEKRLQELDTWILDRGEKLSRAKAVRRLLKAALKKRIAA